MLQLMSLLIEPLHIMCFYILFFTQNWAHIRELRTKKFIKLTALIVVMVLIQSLIELYLPFYPLRILPYVSETIRI